MQIWPPEGATCISCKSGHHNLHWHYQMVLSWYLHQPESHQLSLNKVLDSRTDGWTSGPQINLGPIKIEHLVYQLVEVERGKITQPLLFLCLLATRIKYIYMDNGIPTFNVTNYPM